MKFKILYIILFLLLIVIALFSLFKGAVNVSFTDILNTIYYTITGQGEKVNPYLKTIIVDIRLSRIVMVCLIGVMLSTSGLIVQTVFQNPLADPYIIGIAASATFGAVVAYTLKLPESYYGIFAFLSSLVVSLLIFKLANMGKKFNITMLLIIGIAISAFLGAFTSFVMYLIGEDSFRIIVWTMGFLGNSSWFKVLMLIFPLIFSLAYFYINRYKLDILLSGDEEAHSLGVNVQRLKISLLVVTSLIVGFSVAFSGMIGFVGLIVPHILRLMMGSSNTKLLPAVALGGAVFLLFSDTIAKQIMAPVEIPIGVITAFFGAPFFLYLAISHGRKA